MTDPQLKAAGDRVAMTSPHGADGHILPPSAPAGRPAKGGLLSSIARMFGLGAAPAQPEPRLSLAAFGKHPGWPDHMDDLGVDTDQMAAVKRALYIDGIGGNIDSGAWENLSPADRVSGFGHVFLWRDNADVFAGRLWASRDGKGRSRYPMVVCAQCTGLSRTWVALQLPDWLEDLHGRCARATTAEEVRSAIDATRGRLRAAINGAKGPASDSRPARPVTPANVFEFLSSRPELGPDRRGLLALLYEIDRHMASFRPAAAMKSQVLADHLTRHVRLPGCGLPPFQAMDMWVAFMASQLSPSVALLAIHALDESWVDVIVGRPAPSDLFCILAGRNKIPFTTEIPYTLDDAFVAGASRMIDERRRGDGPVALVSPAEQPAEQGVTSPQSS